MENKPISSFANNLKHIRRAAALTQQEFATRLGISRVTVTRWESGTRQPPRLSLMAIAAALGCEVAELTGQKGD